MKARRGFAAIRLAVAVCAAALASSGVAGAQVIQPLHPFDSATEGSQASGLIQAIDGNFYGTRRSSGPSSLGSVFKMTPAGIVTVLHAFVNGADGAYPEAGLMQAGDGNLYGTMSSGGSFGQGAVFRI